MKRYILLPIFISICAGVFADAVHAGMPNISLTDIAELRLSAMSFFLFIYFLASYIIFRLWNFLRNDFSKLPRLSFKMSLAFVFLWGLAFHLVLVMIAGTRELMTPHAWEKAGIIHKLSPDAFRQLTDTRKFGLERLKKELWSYAEKHDGQFPANEQASGISEDIWSDPTGKVRYWYIGGSKVSTDILPLAYEPDIYGDERLVLLTNGMIELFPIETILTMSKGKKK